VLFQAELIFTKRDKTRTNIGTKDVQLAQGATSLARGSFIIFGHENRNILARVDDFGPPDWQQTGVKPRVWAVES
jgi:hypothetical protein